MLFSGFLFIAAFTGYVFFIRPAYEDILELRGALKARSKLLQEQSLAIAKVNDLIIQYQGTGRLQDTVSLSLPLKEDLSSIFNQLRTLAEINNLSIEIFGVKPQSFKSLSERPLVKNIGTLQLSLKVTGPYQNFKDFLKGVETNIRVMDVQQATVEKVAASGADFFSYNLLINTYYQGE